MESVVVFYENSQNIFNDCSCSGVRRIKGGGPMVTSFFPLSLLRKCANKWEHTLREIGHCREQLKILCMLISLLVSVSDYPMN